jgi:hypothetical protein
MEIIKGNASLNICQVHEKPYKKEILKGLKPENYAIMSQPAEWLFI